MRKSELAEFYNKIVTAYNNFRKEDIPKEFDTNYFFTDNNSLCYYNEIDVWDVQEESVGFQIAVNLYREICRLREERYSDVNFVLMLKTCGISKETGFRVFKNPNIYKCAVLTNIRTPLLGRILALLWGNYMDTEDCTWFVSNGFINMPEDKFLKRLEDVYYKYDSTIVSKTSSRYMMTLSDNQLKLITVLYNTYQTGIFYRNTYLNRDRYNKAFPTFNTILAYAYKLRDDDIKFEEFIHKCHMALQKQDMFYLFKRESDSPIDWQISVDKKNTIFDVFDWTECYDIIIQLYGGDIFPPPKQSLFEMTSKQYIEDMDRRFRLMQDSDEPRKFSLHNIRNDLAITSLLTTTSYKKSIDIMNFIMYAIAKIDEYTNTKINIYYSEAPLEKDVANE